METIYLDHNATTPIRPEVVDAMAACYRQRHANPASQHLPGQRARRQLEDARERIGEIFGLRHSGPARDRVVFTSGGTESNCLALLGIASPHDRQAAQIVISAVEHSSVIEPAEHLLGLGWRLDQLGVDRRGVVRVERLEGLLSENTRLVSVTLANHDTGVVQPVAELAEICHRHRVPLHTDAIQAAGKTPIHFAKLGVDALSLAAHKFQGPSGIGALLIRADLEIRPILFGGHQQWALRPGTEPIALVVGMLTALELCQAELQNHRRHLERLRASFEGRILNGCPGAQINGQEAVRHPNVSNVAFPGLDAQMLLMALDQVGVACSVGSACASGSTELSPTLLAMGLPQEVVRGSLRFSWGPATTETEIAEAVERILMVVGELRQ
ncbi:MAG: cysteine desulfurase family protein [Thermoguttaceae bacterium]